MSLYDKKQLKCYKCGKFVGEVEYDSEVFFAKCSSCANPFPDGAENIAYLKSKYQKNPEIVSLVTVPSNETLKRNLGKVI